MPTPRAAQKADQLCRARGRVGTRAPGWHGTAHLCTAMAAATPRFTPVPHVLPVPGVRSHPVSAPQPQGQL